ncbi:MAG: hypothetical protein GY778_03510, partial [bacterium]|nr:hypothetical protein [bacterium]
DPDDLAKALGRLVDDEAVALAGATARTRYEERYSEARDLEGLESMYQRVVRTISEPPPSRR